MTYRAELSGRALKQLHGPPSLAFDSLIEATRARMQYDITAKLPLDDIADAALDRLLGSTDRIELTGESMRRAPAATRPGRGQPQDQS